MRNYTMCKSKTLNLPPERFAGLDWGNDEKNILHHGTPEPPVYDLHNVNTKVIEFLGSSHLVLGHYPNFLDQQISMALF